MIYQKITFLFLALLALGSALSAQQEWTNFKSKFNRSYASVEEESYRFSVFKENVRQAKIRNSKDPHATFGVTKFSDITTAEFKATYLMNVTMPAVQKGTKIASAPKNVQLPTSFDWSSKGALTPVKDQGQCGSCWDFSATETIESVCFLAGKGLQTLSEQQILDCDTTDGGCNGGWPYTAYQYVMSAGGIDTESSYPYTAQGGNCNFQQSNIGCSITNWQYVTQSQDENAMQNFLYNSSPMSVCVDAEIWQSYTGGVISQSSNCGNSIDHCVQATGWQVMQGMNVWNVRNSWNTDWGVNGYIYIQIGYDICSIAEVVTVPCVGSTC
jgi:C1A family cysteine protease